MEKLRMTSPDLTDANITKLAELFPTVVTETLDEDGKLKRAIDFDLLRQELSDHIVEGPQERYQLEWPGKRAAAFTANAPIAKTLRPVREESVDFDTTKNLFIEGDNLDALKLLQESYLGKVKLIYIDPPYNTGNDFIYEDDFAESSEEYLARSGQRSDSGERLVANPESNGRFHSDWLSMMYPRLRLSRNLLSDDGLFVASIDENEVSNLRALCDEVFGAANFVFQIAVLSNPKGRNQDKYVARCHEYLVGYSRQRLPKGAVSVPRPTSEIEKNFRLRDDRGAYRELELRNTHREFGRFNRPNLYYPFFVDAVGTVSLNEVPGSTTVLPNWDDGFEGCWTWSAAKSQEQIDELVGKQVGGNWKVYRKAYAIGEDGVSMKQVKSLWAERQFHTEVGQADFGELFGNREKLFQAPKPVDLVRQVIMMGAAEDSIILDFFAGSGTTAHAVLEANAEDGGSRRFILVQLDEETDPLSEAAKAGYRTISQLSRERVRRAAQAVDFGEQASASIDRGFRALRVDSTNMIDVACSPDDLVQASLSGFANSVKEGRGEEDLLFQVLLEAGLEITEPVSAETLAGQRYWTFAGDALMACFADEVTDVVVRTIAVRRPLRAVFKDSGFANDSARINAEQIFRELSPETEVRTI
ncbi:site-specific DNA-methyltransferase [Leucobacter alluvii]|uniref:Site-specific DNA-methyltransferase n=1 Tax=Leucobacter alluvii TaxID=340321 RepID=A0ABP5MSE3_9MICO